MTCNEIEDVLPDYLDGKLKPEKVVAIDAHLNDCASCKDQVAFWKKLASLPEEQPDAASRRRFDLMMNAYEEGRREEQSLKARRAASPSWREFVPMAWVRAPWAQAAAAVALLVLGLALGKNLSSQPPTNSNELAALHTEISGMRQLMVLSMLQQPSASERLQGVSWSEQVNTSNPEIVSALVHTVRHDSSVDVRLAALDALRRYKDQPHVRKEILDSLQAEQSPLVQIALIDLMVELRERQALDYLKKFEQSKALNPTVRQRAEWGINQLSRG